MKALTKKEKARALMKVLPYLMTEFDRLTNAIEDRGWYGKTYFFMEELIERNPRELSDKQLRWISRALDVVYERGGGICYKKQLLPRKFFNQLLI